MTQPVTQKHKRGDASYMAGIAPWEWQPGKSANPGGVPKHDIAKEVAQAIFLNSPEMIYNAFCKILRRRNAYAFQVFADRAFGKLKETHAIEHSPYKGMSDADLNQRIRELETKLGYARELSSPADSDVEKKPN